MRNFGKSRKKQIEEKPLPLTAWAFNILYGAIYFPAGFSRFDSGTSGVSPW